MCVTALKAIMVLHVAEYVLRTSMAQTVAMAANVRITPCVIQEREYVIARKDGLAFIVICLV